MQHSWVSLNLSVRCARLDDKTRKNRTKYNGETYKFASINKANPNFIILRAKKVKLISLILAFWLWFTLHRIFNTFTPHSGV